MRSRTSAVALAGAAMLAVGLAAPVAGAAVTATAPSLTASGALATATGSARTLSMPGGGYLVVNSLGEVSMVAADGQPVWQRSDQSLYRDWDMSWQNPAGPPYTPQLAWAGVPTDPLEFAGGESTGGVDDITPYAAGDLGGRSVVAVAEVVGVNLSGNSTCELCTSPFNVPGSGLHLGTFVTVLDAGTGRTLYHELDPGYVTQLAIAAGRLIIGDETGDPQIQGNIGEWNSVTTVRALTFSSAAAGLTAHRAWTYSTAAPWARLLALAVTGGQQPGIAVAWSDTPSGLGVPGPPDGHVLLLDARTGGLRWQVRTPGYPVLLAADNARHELAAVQLTDPAEAVGYTLTGLRYTNGTVAVSAPRSGSLPLSLAVGSGNTGAWAVGAVDATVQSSVYGLSYTPIRGRVTLTDPATGRALWSVVQPPTSDGVPLPGGLVQSGGQVFVGSWIGVSGTVASTESSAPVDSIAALSYRTGATDWEHSGDVGDPLSMSATTPGAWRVRAVTSNQVTQTYAAGGAVASSTFGPGDFLSATTASVASPSSTDLVAGNQDGDVYAFQGRALAGGSAKVLWRTRLPGAVHQITGAVEDGRQVLVAAATSAVGVLDARTGRILRLIETPGTYTYTITVAAAGDTQEVIVPGSSLTAYSLATGARLWQHAAPSGAWFSNAVYAAGVVAAEYSSTPSQLPIGVGSATEMAAVGVSASTGAVRWISEPDPADIEYGQLWNGVAASPYIPGAAGTGVAFTWMTTTNMGEVDVRDISTGALLYSDISGDLGSHMAFLAGPGVGLIAEGTRGAVQISAAGGSGVSELSGDSMAIAKSTGGTPELLTTDGQVSAYPADAFTSSTATPLANYWAYYDAGILVSGDFAGNGSEQVVSLPQDASAYTVVMARMGVSLPLYLFNNPLQHGLAVLSLTASAATGAPALPRAPAASPASGATAGRALPVGQAGASAPAPEPLRSGTALPVTTPAMARHTAVRLAAGTEPAGYSPAVIGEYLGLSAEGAGQTIAIVDAYDDQDITSDAEEFSEQFGLPGVCGAGGAAGDCFTLDVREQSATAGSNPTWALETSLDVEWAHAIAPKAKILLIEANDAAFASLFRAVDTAVAAHPAAVSMSWDIAGEFSDETYYDHFCAVTSTVCVVASGDNGHPGGYPAYNPAVIAVGGTTLDLTDAGSVTSEITWDLSGGGRSWVEREPAYERGVQGSGWQEMPDVSYDADPAAGVAIYDSIPLNGLTGWWEVGGTSVGAPSWSAILADADQLRAAKDKKPLTAAGFAAQRALYALPSRVLARITTGPDNGFCPVGCAPESGYDEITGLGSPRSGIAAALAAG